MSSCDGTGQWTVAGMMWIDGDTCRSGRRLRRRHRRRRLSYIPRLFDAAAAVGNAIYRRRHDVEKRRRRRVQPHNADGGDFARSTLLTSIMRLPASPVPTTTHSNSRYGQHHQQQRAFIDLPELYEQFSLQQKGAWKSNFLSLFLSFG